MSDFDIPSIAAELNGRALSHPIGQIQKIRQKLKKLDRLPGTDIFRIGSKSIAFYRIVAQPWSIKRG